MIPQVSVVMPVFNVGAFVKEAIESILNQSYTNFEFIIIDDASTDNTHEVIKSFEDVRLQVYTNEVNKGLAANLNRAIMIAKGKYILRMDGDDISHPDRIKIQVKFMESNPDVGIVGSWIKLFGVANTVNEYPTEDISCKFQLLFGVPFAHPSVAFRKSDLFKFNLFYNEELTQYGEDYDLWVRAARVIKFSNIPEVLLNYRTFPSELKKEAEDKRFLQEVITRKKVLQEYNIHLNEQEFSIYNSLTRKEIFHTHISSYLSQCELLLHKINDHLINKRPDAKFQLEKCLAYHWFYLCYVQESFVAVYKYLTSDFKKLFVRRNKLILFKLMVKPFISVLKS